MRCPSCGHEEDKVVDSRATKENAAVRRRRECLKCGHRFTTYEYIEHAPVIVVKKDGRREHFSREKILNGLLRACEKRPVPRNTLEKLVNDVERTVCNSVRDEIPTTEIGNEVMNRLAGIDQVAYVRFASVYRDFKDVTQFLDELRNLLEKKV
ncbi:MAG TPA: transcriptional repressor NrdR [Candidatus Eisenbacteria bacterium]|uniref:Transcriptional repressor NrdR n=1 Tax=Eiseniibacteriota bacterium TaxID=2212470 RepID=A0A7V2F551_UNCEI|nr:transcriptional repressor NrdR [Candidatus Eisenbacteria bacterium]